MSDKLEQDNRTILMDYYFKEYVRLTDQKKTASQASTTTAGFILVFQSAMFTYHVQFDKPEPLILAHVVVMSLFCYISYLQNNIDAIHVSLSKIENRFNSLAGENILNWSHKTMKKEKFNIHSSLILTIVLVVLIQCVLLAYTVHKLWATERWMIVSCLLVIGTVALISLISLKNMVGKKTH